MERTTIFLLLLLSVFTLKDYVRGGAISDLGPLTITLDCSTDHAIQERSINVTWLLNSTLPNYNQVPECKAYINCGNGSLKDENGLCDQSQFQYGWRFDHIPLTEHFCNITISYDPIGDNLNKLYYNSSICTFSDDINTTAKIQHVTENPIVGNLYEIQCIVHTNVVVNSSIVNITWIGPNNETIVTSRRTNITETSDGNNHTSILQLAYLSEKDEGLHICQVTILNSTVFEFFKIEDLLIPAPILNVTVLNNKKTVGSELSLGCNVTTVRGVSTNVEIVWIKDDILMKEMSDPRINIKNYSTHSSILQFLYLSENDKSEYTCRATILNTSYSTSTQLTNFDIPTVNVSVTAVNQNLGDVLLLKCDVNVVKGITSSVYILWTINGTNLTIYNGNVTENVTAYTYYYNGTEKLTPNYNNTLYLCQVIINNRSVGNNSVTYNVKVPATAPVSSDTKSSNAIVISVISIATVTTLILLIIIVAFGIYVYLAKRNQKMQEGCIGHEDQTKRNNKIQEVCRDYEFRVTDDNGFSLIGKENPSTCESLSANQKVKEWIKTFQMLDDYESVTNEYMLNYVYGHTTKTTQITDSGLDDSEFDSGLSSSKQNTYISHKAVEDMFYVKFDETKQPDTQDLDVNDEHLVVAHVPNSSESNSECQSPSASADSYPLLAVQGNQPLLCTNISADPTNNGSYIDHYIASNNDNITLPLHSIDDCTLTTTVNGNYIDHQATFNSQPPPCSAEERSYNYHDVTSENNSKSLPLDSTNESTLATTADGNYIDQNISSNSMQPPFDCNTTETAGEGSYIDRYIASNNDNSEPYALHTSATSVSAAADGSYIDNDTTFSTDQTLSNSNNTA